MKQAVLPLLVLLVGSAVSAQNPRDRENPGYRDPRLSEPGQIAPLLEGLGEHHHPITTSLERAQLFFDQGLRLTYGFNHREAARAFREAARIDPTCAMAHWGLALVHGPNLNLPMDEESAGTAYEAIQKAVALKPGVSRPEQAYIDALASRYVADPGSDREALDQAYAVAMEKLSQSYPSDPDAATLYGAALMNLSPWDYWWGDGQPYERTKKFLEVFQSVIRHHPRHPGALHYYIHAVEAHHPEWAVESAETLEPLMPGAGHMVHMPSHIYMRMGRYQDAFQSNVKAMAADEGYITQCRAQGIYPLAYYPHNLHFLWWASTNLGRSAEALATARKTAAQMPAKAVSESPQFQTFLVTPLYALVRFGLWEEILKEPEPDRGLLFFRGIYHYARGSALRAEGRLKKAGKELKKLQVLAEDEGLRAMLWTSPPADVLQIAAKTLAGEIAASRGEYDRALLLLEMAVRLQDALAYTEPPDWHYPVRQSLGAVLLEARRPAEAAVVYWEDLRRRPENGWSLFGLAESLRAQGKQEAAAQIEARFEKAWATADVRLAASRC